MGGDLAEQAVSRTLAKGMETEQSVHVHPSKALDEGHPLEVEEKVGMEREGWLKVFMCPSQRPIILPVRPVTAPPFVPPVSSCPHRGEKRTWIPWRTWSGGAANLVVRAGR